MKYILAVLCVIFAIVIIGAVVMLFGGKAEQPAASPAATVAAADTVAADTGSPPAPAAAVPSPPPAPEPEPAFTPMQEICLVMDMAVTMPGTPCRAGTRLYGEVSWTNVSGKVIRVPQNLGTAHIIGSRVQYIERLGVDPVIAGLGEDKRRGNRYRLTRANINAYKELLQPGEKVASQRNSIDLLDTTGFPPGRYRYAVEYFQFRLPAAEETAAEVVQTRYAEFSIE